MTNRLTKKIGIVLISAMGFVHCGQVTVGGSVKNGIQKSSKLKDITGSYKCAPRADGEYPTYVQVDSPDSNRKVFARVIDAWRFKVTDIPQIVRYQVSNPLYKSGLADVDLDLAENTVFHYSSTARSYSLEHTGGMAVEIQECTKLRNDEIMMNGMFNCQVYHDNGKASWYFIINGNNTNQNMPQEHTIVDFSGSNYRFDLKNGLNTLTDFFVKEQVFPGIDNDGKADIVFMNSFDLGGVNFEFTLDSLSPDQLNLRAVWYENGRRLDGRGTCTMQHYQI